MSRLLRSCFKTSGEVENVRFQEQTKGIFKGIAALSLRKLPKYVLERWRFTAIKRVLKQLLRHLNPIPQYFLLFTFYFLLQTSCTPDPPPVLNYQDRQLVDSLFRTHVDSMKPVLDSLCEMRHDSAVQYKVDSMMMERQSEIDKYLERIKNQQQ